MDRLYIEMDNVERRTNYVFELRMALESIARAESLHEAQADAKRALNTQIPELL